MFKSQKLYNNNNDNNNYNKNKSENFATEDISLLVLLNEFYLINCLECSALYDFQKILESL